MESKKFYIGEQFTSYDDLKVKMKTYEKEKYLNVSIRDSRTIKATRVKKKKKIQQ